LAGWPWPLDGVQAWFDGLWSWISEAAVSAVRVVSGWINDSAAWLWNQITAVGGWLWDRFQDLGAKIQTVIGEVGKTVFDAVVAAVQAVQSGAATTFTWIWEQLQAAGKWITDTVFGWITGALRWATDTFHWLQSVIGESASWIVNRLSGFWDGTLRWMTDTFHWLQGEVAKAGSWIVDQVGLAFDAASTAIGDTISSVFKPILEPMQSIFKNLWAWLSQGVAGFGVAVGGFLSERVVAPLRAGLEGLGAWLINSVQGLFRTVLNFFASPKSPDPEDPVGSIANVMTTVLGFGTSIFLPMLAGELVHPLKQMGLGYLSAMMYDMAGFGRVASALTLELATISYIWPLRYSLNQLWRPRIPDTRSADQMLFEGYITQDDWRSIYQRQGWKDSYIDAWQKTMYREPSQRTLLAMLEDPEIPEEWVRKKLAEIGFTVDDIDTMIGYKRRLIETKRLASYNTEKSRLVTNAKSDFVLGFILEDTLRANLAAAEIDPDEIEYHVADARGDRVRAYKKGLLDAYEDGYIKDLITDDDLTARAKEVLVDPDALTLFLDRAYIRKFKKPKAE